MAQFDLVVRGGTVFTASESARCDIGVRGGRIVALADVLPQGAREIDATGKYVLPGGIDSHCHLEQPSSGGVMTADDFYSGTVSAAFGGTTTVIPFAAQMKGQSLRAVVTDYHAAARPKAVVDYAFHLIVSDPTEQVLGQELPALIHDGYTSFKIYTTYDALKLDDGQVLEVLSVARRHGAMVMVHAENHDVIKWLSKRLLDGGHRQPRYHAVSHSRIGESEATHRVIAMSELIDVPILIVHVSAAEAAAEIRSAQTRGLRVFGETCPQYLFLTQDDLDRPGMEGAKFCCSPPPRDQAAQEALWLGLANGTFQVFSSDHAPYSFDEKGKLRGGPNGSFKDIANGVPGLEIRMPMLFSAGVVGGRIDIHQFVALTATNAAKIYGLFPRKGTIAIGSDADLAIWNPEAKVVIRWSDLHDQVGYTPYEGHRVTGWPETVISRGRVVVENGTLHVDRGSGEFLKCDRPDRAKPTGRLQPEMDPTLNFGARLL